MSKIRLLPPDIISKIAAGEVIDRPASVLKELLENAIDAAATSITIDITEAGRSLIKIQDNGSGIARDDIEKIFDRHSTSKIATAEDLFDIHSLGFRGEALYSICAVSDITVCSKTAEQDSGWEIHRRGGTHLGLKPIAMPDGTEIEVKELFFNTPARRKFLKSATTEIHQIIGTIIPYALFYPQCRFLLRHGKKTLLDLPAANSLKERIAHVLNLQEDFLIETQKDFPDGSLAIHMIMGDINIIRSKRDMQFLFINGRPVHNKNISFHLNDVYRLILPPRHYPFFFISMTLPASEVDVNIHPSKREVKIRDEQNVCAAIRRLCENALMNAGRPKALQDPAAETKRTLPSARIMIRQALSEHEKHAALPEKAFEETVAHSVQQPTEQYTFPHDDNAADTIPSLFEAPRRALKDTLSHAAFVGSFARTYLFFESEGTLLVIDQHAAQERIMFEQFIRQMQDSRIEVQNLLAPYLLKISPQDLVRWEDIRDTLTQIGFDTTLFDDETLAIQSHPALINDPQRAVKELLAHGDTARCSHEQIARRACRASVMSGDPLNRTQAEFQREQLLQCRDPFTCPHGRPTVIEISAGFLNKQFLRT